MNTCIFCNIVSKVIPAHIVYVDTDFIVFLDIHPQSPGHVQVIPKQHYRWVWDVPQTQAYFDLVTRLARAQRTAFDTEWILSKIVGDEVEHAHVWVFPNSKVAGDKFDFETNKHKLIQALR